MLNDRNTHTNWKVFLAFNLERRCVYFCLFHYYQPFLIFPWWRTLPFILTTVYSLDQTLTLWLLRKRERSYMYSLLLVYIDPVVTEEKREKLLVYFRYFAAALILAWRTISLFIPINTNALHKRMLCAKFGLMWPSAYMKLQFKWPKTRT